MGKERRSLFVVSKNASPGPCAYSPKVRYAVPSWSMHGTKNRNIYNINQQVPGPGAYKLTEKVMV